MIRLRNILQEFEYGDRLFDDPKQFSMISRADTSFMKYWAPYIKGEENTSDEYHLLSALRSWSEDPPDEQWLNQRVDDLKFLLTLKNKYRKILDPSESKFAHPKYVFRVATIPMSTAVKALKTLSSNELRTDYSNKNPIDIDIPITLKSRSKRGYYSFTTQFDVAMSLAGHAQSGAAKYDQIYYDKRIPAIIKVEHNSPRLLFNPDFFEGISRYGAESETLYVDSKIEAAGIVLPANFIKEIVTGGERYMPSAPIEKYRDSLMNQFPDDPDVQALYKILDPIVNS